MIEMINMGMSL